MPVIQSHHPHSSGCIIQRVFPLACESALALIIDGLRHADVLQILPRFGLIDESPERWSTFATKIKALNENAEPGVQYKVFFLGRHGQGFRTYSYHVRTCLVPWSSQIMWPRTYMAMTWVFVVSSICISLIHSLMSPRGIGSPGIQEVCLFCNPTRSLVDIGLVTG